MNRYFSIAELKKIAKFVHDIDNELTRLDTWWTAVSSVGKVNHHEVGFNFLDSLQESQKEFSQLRKDFLIYLSKIVYQNLDTSLTLKSNAVIDLLYRNLFERTADISFLANDQQVLSLCHNSKPDFDNALLKNYCHYYSVYKNVLILNNDNKLIACANPTYLVDDALISDTMRRVDSGYMEWNHQTELQHYIIYSHNILDSNGNKAGIISLLFDLKDEIKRIFDFVKDGSDALAIGLLDDKSKTIAGVNLEAKHDYLYFDKEKVVKKGHFDQFQGYKGLGWHSVVSMPVNLNSHSTDYQLNKRSYLYPSDLSNIQNIASFSLMLVVINGKVISLQNRARAFLPILEDFDRIGQQINSCLNNTISHIYKINYDRVLGETIFSANFACELLSRSFYERANDCRWWVLQSSIAKGLMNNINNEVNKILDSIHDLYSLYSHIIVLDLKLEEINRSTLSHSGCIILNENQIKSVNSLESGEYLAYELTINQEPSFVFFLTHFDRK